MPTSSIAANLTYTPPLSATQQQIAFSNIENYTPQSVGTITVPIGTAANFTFSIPFGTIHVADVVILFNRGNQDMGVRINGVPVAPAILYQIPPGGMLCISHPTAPGALPIASVNVDTTVIQSALIGQFDYYVFGAT